MWNRRIANLILRKFTRSEDTKRLKFYPLYIWTNFKLISLIIDFAKNGPSTNSLNLTTKKSTYALRSKFILQRNHIHNTTEDNAAKIWNNLNSDTQTKLLKKKKLAISDII